MIDQSPPKGPPPEQRPPLVQPRIKAAPKIRQLYWCDFPQDAQLPEMWKRRPVVVVSYRNTLRGHCTVVPMSTNAEGRENSPWALELSLSMTNVKSWACCDLLTSVACSRLSSSQGPIPRLSEEEFNKVLERVMAWLPKLPP